VIGSHHVASLLFGDDGDVLVPRLGEDVWRPVLREGARCGAEAREKEKAKWDKREEEKKRERREGDKKREWTP
jgi:hypothetical protein